MQNIEGKVVIITGASSGLGEATAKELSAQGAKLVLAARRADRINALAESFQKNGKEAIAIETDVTDFNQMKSLAEITIKQFGRIDVILNNAGIMPATSLMSGDIDTWQKVMNVNVMGVLNGIAAVLPFMKEQKSGQIINVSSVAGIKIGKGSGIYSASKYAVKAITEGLRLEAKDYNLRTTVIYPGAIDTELPYANGKISEGTKMFYDNYAIPTDSFARVVAFAISQPENVDVNEFVLRPTNQDF